MFMKATQKNAETVNEIIKILHGGDYSVEEAYSILEFVKRRIEYTSKVVVDDITFSESV